MSLPCQPNHMEQSEKKNLQLFLGHGILGIATNDTMIQNGIVHGNAKNFDRSSIDIQVQ